MNLRSTIEPAVGLPRKAFIAMLTSGKWLFSDLAPVDRQFAPSATAWPPSFLVSFQSHPIPK